MDSEIKIDGRATGREYKVITGDFRITDNLFYTTASQNQAILINFGVRGIVENNTLCGPVRTIRACAWINGDGQVIIRNNDGWKTENAAKPL